MHIFKKKNKLSLSNMGLEEGKLTHWKARKEEPLGVPWVVFRLSLSLYCLH